MDQGVLSELLELRYTIEHIESRLRIIENAELASREEFEFKFRAVLEKIKIETGIKITPEDLLELF